ncbi:MAG: hypothetical protein KH446_07830 [Oscillibacter sp.]|uniref:hypothetical protein n=1 Tax=Oscillibacter sp. TaxID=1945593 RepID=UPI001DB6E1B6|nr:hypothetical protein [Oscillibacter sp.]MBS6291608.1 hypothetical protein [Oscillibacter sp.]
MGLGRFQASKSREITVPQRVEKPTAAHNPEVVASSPAPQPKNRLISQEIRRFFFTFCPKKFPEELRDFAKIAVHLQLTQTMTQTGL